jgi:hypothetical protein
MNKLHLASRAEQGFFSELVVTLPFAIISAHFFVGFRQKENFLELILKPGYPLAFGFTFVVAFGMMLYVKFFTRWLNKRYPLEKGGSIKWGLHIFYTGFLLLFIEFLASTGYFYFFGGHHISNTVYFNSYVLLIVLYILLINLYYNSKTPIVISETIAEPVKPAEETQNKETLYAEIVAYARSKDVAFISITEKIVYARTAAGEAVYWNHNITDSGVALTDHDFYQVSRGHIIRRDIIQAVEQAPLKHKMIIVLQDGFGIGEKRIEIPSGKIVSFKRWLNQQ